VLGAIALTIHGWWRRRHVSAASTSDVVVLPRLEFVAACWLVIPTAVLVASQFLFPDFTARYASDSAPAAAILIACALSWAGRRWSWLPAVGVALVTASVLPIYLSQRGPYSKNDSDWAQISAVVHQHASASAAIAFDESVRPSRRPRLALHTYPAEFAGLEDVTLETPFTENTTWSDRAYSIGQAASIGRLNGVRHLWLVEYATPQHTDTYGIATLRSLGFAQSAQFRTFRSVVYEFSR